MKRVVFPFIVLLLHFVVREVDLFLADKSYPDLSCHKGYDIEEGQQDAKAATDECQNRVKNYTEANVCFEKCILTWMGVLNKTTWSVRTSKEMAIDFLRYAFQESKVGRIGAQKLATKIYVDCYHVLEKLKATTMICKEWGPFYDCMDNAWKCQKGRGLDEENNNGTDSSEGTKKE